jgi:hypothetical protein
MLKLKTGSITTDFDGFGAVKDLMEPYQGARSVFCQLILFGLIVHPHTTISLDVETGLITTLDEVRINVRALLNLICDNHLSAKTTVRFHLTYSEEGGTHEEYATARLDDLCKQLFLLLPDYIANNAPWLGRNGPPDVWINGRGEVLEMSLSGSGPSPPVSVPHKSGSLSKMEVHFRGYSMALTDTRKPATYSKLDGTASLHSLTSAWRDLRRTHWPGWERREGYKPVA